MSPTAAPDSLDDVARACRRQVRHRALLAAGVAAVPLPAIDWLTDVALLMRLLPDINRAFGLAPEHVARMTPARQLWVCNALAAGGGAWLGRMAARAVLMGLLRVVGVRLTAQQVAKYVPVVGQLVSAALTFTAMRHVGDRHIARCLEISRRMQREENQFPG